MLVSALPIILRTLWPQLAPSSVEPSKGHAPATRLIMAGQRSSSSDNMKENRSADLLLPRTPVKPTDPMSRGIYRILREDGSFAVRVEYEIRIRRLPSICHYLELAESRYRKRAYADAIVREYSRFLVTKTAPGF